MPARRLPPLRALEAFMRTVRLGSARAAAEEIGLSPSALSGRITNLEEFVGKKLFTRARQSMALTDEGDGLGAYRHIAASAPDFLTPGGRILVEIGPSQGKSVAALFQAAGLAEDRIIPDLDGRDRVVVARMPR